MYLQSKNNLSNLVTFSEKIVYYFIKYPLINPFIIYIIRACFQSCANVELGSVVVFAFVPFVLSFDAGRYGPPAQQVEVYFNEGLHQFDTPHIEEVAYSFEKDRIPMKRLYAFLGEHPQEYISKSMNNFFNPTLFNGQYGDIYKRMIYSINHVSYEKGVNDGIKSANMYNATYDRAFLNGMLLGGAVCTVVVVLGKLINFI